MRQYRGMTKEGKWVYGYYVVEGFKKPKPHFIVQPGGRWNEVLPETVGQSTGLKDKNGEGVEIYDKDLLVINETDPVVVLWRKLKGQWWIRGYRQESKTEIAMMTAWIAPLMDAIPSKSYIQVVGTIHDKEQK